MSRKFGIAVVAAFVLLSSLGYLVHGYLLQHAYSHLPNLMRTADDSAAHMVYIVIAQLLTAIALVWIYERGRQDKPWMGQGVRFGVAVAVFGPTAKFITYYAVQPEPYQLAVHQILGEGIAMVIVCVVVARVYK